MKKNSYFLRTPRLGKNLRFKFLTVLVFLFCASFCLYLQTDRAHALKNTSAYSYEYDANGRLIKVRDESANIILEYHYDHLGNILSNGKKVDNSSFPDKNNLDNQRDLDNQNNSSSQDHSTGSSEAAQRRSDAFLINNEKKAPNSHESKEQKNTDKVKSDFSRFEDIKNHQAKDEITFVLERGYFVGTSSNSFSPNLEVDRAMMVSVLERVEKSLVISSGENPTGEKNPVSSNQKNSNVFQDIDKDSYYAKSVNWAYTNKLIKGVSSIRFAPKEKMTREQLAVILSNYLKFRRVQMQKDMFAETELRFKDAESISAWAREDIKLMVNLGILKGRLNGEFGAKDDVTRAEIAIVIKRLIALLEN